MNLSNKTPTTQEEKEIAAAMEFFWIAVEAMGKRYPGIPQTALCVGLINVGAQIGVAHIPADVLTQYFADVSSQIAAGRVVPYLGGGQDGHLH